MSNINVFRGTKRLAITENDVCTSKLARIFQVDPSTIYMVDDSNTTIFPEDDGMFVGINQRSHYEVHGCSQGESNSPAVSTPHHPGAAPTLRFGFASRPTTPAATQSYRRPVVKTIPRSIQLVESDGSKILLPVQTIYLRLSETDLNVSSVAQLVQEQLDSEETIVLLDSKGSELLDTNGTQGRDFWKQQTRKILCMTESSYAEYQSGRKKKESRKTIAQSATSSASCDEMKENLKQVKDFLEPLIHASENQAIVKMKKKDLECITEAFSCVICKQILRSPVFSVCCSSLIACTDCMEVWHQNTSHCPKCREENSRLKISSASGLSECMAALTKLCDPDD